MINIIKKIINYISNESLSTYSITKELNNYRIICFKKGNDAHIIQKNIKDFNDTFEKTNLYIEIKRISYIKESYFIELLFITNKNTQLDFINSLFRLYNI